MAAAVLPRSCSLPPCHPPGCLAPPQCGWNHQQTLKDLEVKRKVRSAAFYATKKRLALLRVKAVAQVEAGKV